MRPASRELAMRRIPFERQLELPVMYKGQPVDCGYRIDLVVAGAGVVEVNAVDVLLPIHEAQMLTYLRLGGWKAGLLVNFSVPILKRGIRRLVWKLED
jgi:GxxExxY protein